MKQLKKTCALVLALVMIMGLATVGARASVSNVTVEITVTAGNTGLTLGDQTIPVTLSGEGFDANSLEPVNVTAGTATFTITTLTDPTKTITASIAASEGKWAAASATITPGDVADNDTLRATIVLQAPGSQVSSQTGTAGMEGYIDPTIISVVLPTVNQDQLAYTVDPQKLASKTEGAKYSSAAIDADSTILFKNSTVGENDATVVSYSKDTDTFVAQNKGMRGVTLTVEASVPEAKKAMLNGSATWTDTAATSATVYLALVSQGTAYDKTESHSYGLTGTASTEVLSTSTGKASKTISLDACPIAWYTWSYANSAYKATVKTEGTAVGKSVVKYPYAEISLTGACNTAAAWQDIADDALPAVTLTWTAAVNANVENADAKTDAETVAPTVVAPSATVAFATESATTGANDMGVVITYSLGTTAASVTVSATSPAAADKTSEFTVDTSAKTITNATRSDRIVTLTFKDGDGATVKTIVIDMTKDPYTNTES